ncbi:MAG: insulinase family protein, partial [Planctomycetota bacterium]
MQLISRTPVPALGVELITYRHARGLVHQHLACADEHRACVIAFRTPPTDSSGLPHILEHTTLCGSQRYPVRDPFFMMLRRSLATFMNAMTGNDLTMYPFATQVSKDFDHLLGVYLDAVFRPRLDERDFHQEGHRLAPDKDGVWKRQGVVFNEMQGAMDATDAQAGQAIQRSLFPDTCYRYNSGGEPTDIPRLTHGDLVAFHRRCYRPANAVVVTYGDVDCSRFHAELTTYLADDPGIALAPPKLQPQLTTMQRLDVPVPWSEGQDVEDVTTTGYTWAWGDTASIDEVLESDLLERVLLGHAGSPLRRALESSGLGRSISPSGYATHCRNGMFTAAIEGLPPADYAKVTELITATIAQIATAGVAETEITSALHQLELSRREVRGDGWPYGLELCMRMVDPWNLGKDGLPFLDPSPALTRLRARVAKPNWLQEQVRQRLLANPHKVLFAAHPDRQFHDHFHTRVAELDRADLAEVGAEPRLRAQALALAERQAHKDDFSVLPDLDLADVPRHRRWAEGTTAAWDKGDLTVFSAPTNGITHFIAALPLALDAELELLPLLSAALGDLGCGTRDYAAQSALLASCSGGVRCWVETGSDPDNQAVVRPWFLLEIKGLREKSHDFLPLLAETLCATRFDEQARLRELVEQSLAGLQERVTRAGSAMAASAAQRSFAGAAGLGYRLGGLGRLAWLKQTASTISSDNPAAGTGLAALAERLARLRDQIVGHAPYAALIGDAVTDPAMRRTLTWPTEPLSVSTPATRAAGSPPVATAFTTSTTVNHCALCFPAPPLNHPDAASLAVGMRILSNRWLHPRLRERGGAYGGSAHYSAGAVALTSYRDPRLADTYQDMRDGLAWLTTAADDAAALKEAQLGVLQSLDAPGSPAGEARRRFLGDLTGRSPAVIEAFRQRILTSTGSAMRAAIAAWLPQTGGSSACVTS